MHRADFGCKYKLCDLFLGCLSNRQSKNELHDYSIIYQFKMKYQPKLLLTCSVQILLKYIQLSFVSTMYYRARLNCMCSSVLNLLDEVKSSHIVTLRYPRIQDADVKISRNSLLSDIQIFTVMNI